MSHQPSEETPEKDEKAPTSLFVGDLSFFCSETDLSSLFGQYGQVVSSQLKRGRSGDSLMHGFVEMESHEQADVARVTLTDKKFMGRRMRVNWAYTAVIPRNRDGWVQVHVSFVTRELNHIINEEVLDALFSPFGEVADITIKRYIRDTDGQVQSGYGFIFFYESEAASAAVKKIRKILIDGVTYDSSFSYKSEKELNSKNESPRERSDKLRTNPPYKSQSRSDASPYVSHANNSSAASATQQTHQQHSYPQQANHTLNNNPYHYYSPQQQQQQQQQQSQVFYSLDTPYLPSQGPLPTHQQPQQYVNNSHPNSSYVGNSTAMLASPSMSYMPIPSAPSPTFSFPVQHASLPSNTGDFSPAVQYTANNNMNNQNMLPFSNYQTNVPPSFGAAPSYHPVMSMSPVPPPTAYIPQYYVAANFDPNLGNNHSTNSINNGNNSSNYAMSSSSASLPPSLPPAPIVTTPPYPPVPPGYLPHYQHTHAHLQTPPPPPPQLLVHIPLSRSSSPSILSRGIHSLHNSPTPPSPMTATSTGVAAAGMYYNNSSNSSHNNNYNNSNIHLTASDSGSNHSTPTSYSRSKQHHNSHNTISSDSNHHSNSSSNNHSHNHSHQHARRIPSPLTTTLEKHSFATGSSSKSLPSPRELPAVAAGGSGGAANYVKPPTGLGKRAHSHEKHSPKAVSASGTPNSSSHSNKSFVFPDASAAPSAQQEQQMHNISNMGSHSHDSITLEENMERLSVGIGALSPADTTNANNNTSNNNSARDTAAAIHHVPQPSSDESSH